jgi:murein DD-endopeptidase MepM/ murein hydrolase activator NlpD
MGKSILIRVSENSPQGSAQHIFQPSMGLAYAILAAVGIAIPSCVAVAINDIQLRTMLARENASLRHERDELLEIVAARDENTEILQGLFDQTLTEQEKLREFVNVSDPDRTIRPKMRLDDRKQYLASSSDIGALVSVRAAMARRDGEQALANAKELTAHMQEEKTLLASIPSIMPTKGYITSGFGMRIDPFTGLHGFHGGIDISAKPGTPVVATGDGIVTFVGPYGNGGNTIMVDHGYGVETFYMHLSRTFAKTGNMVQRSQEIGAVGNTGRSTGPHLHYGLKVSGIPTDPRRFILK